MIIKANNIKNLTDARFFAAQPMCKWLTFHIEKLDDLVVAQELESWITGPLLSAYMPNAELTQLYHAFAALHLTALDMNSGVYRNCKDELEVPVLLRLHYSSSISYHYYLDKIDKIKAIVLEVDDISNVSSTHLKSLCDQYPTILKSNFSTDSLDAMLSVVTPYGIELDGNDETSKGEKSFDLTQDLVDVLEKHQ